MRYCYGDITRIRSRITMAAKPNPASPTLISEKWENTPAQTSIKCDPLNLIPNKPFIWVEATVNAAAEQNPDITGVDMKSTTNPEQL